MPESISVVTATKDDRERVINFVREIYQEYDLIVYERIVADLEDLESSYKGGYFGILTDRNGEILGTFGLYPIDHEKAEIRKMYLKPWLRGKGLGKWMLEDLLTKAREMGFGTVELETSSKFTEAIGLYRKFGFHEILSDNSTPSCDKTFIIQVGQNG